MGQEPTLVDYAIVFMLEYSVTFIGYGYGSDDDDMIAFLQMLVAAGTGGLSCYA